MKPEDIESLIKRMAGLQNYFGREAKDMARRFGVPLDAQGNFDCDARAAIAIREATKHGYQAKTAVQFLAGQKPHRYVVLEKDGVKTSILRVPE